MALLQVGGWDMVNLDDMFEAVGKQMQICQTQTSEKQLKLGLERKGTLHWHW